MSLHPWKHSVADVYANNYGIVVQDYLGLVIEPSLQTLQRRRDALIENPATDDLIKALQVHDHAALEQKAAMAFCLAIQSLWEQQIRAYVRCCVQQFSIPGVTVDDAETKTWGEGFYAIFKAARGLELQSFKSFNQLNLLMLLGNVCRHGEGPAANSLWKKRPDLWPESIPVAPLPLPGDNPSKHTTYRPPISSIEFRPELLRSLVEAVVLFWRDLEYLGLKTFMPSEMSDASIEELLSNRVRVR